MVRDETETEQAESTMVGRVHARRKTFAHPEVGTITVDCEALSV